MKLERRRFLDMSEWTDTGKAPDIIPEEIFLEFLPRKPPFNLSPDYYRAPRGAVIGDVESEQIPPLEEEVGTFGPGVKVKIWIETIQQEITLTIRKGSSLRTLRQQLLGLAETLLEHDPEFVKKELEWHERTRRPPSTTKAKPKVVLELE